MGQFGLEAEEERVTIGGRVNLGQKEYQGQGGGMKERCCLWFLHM